ncbi:MAG TPA: hypothetical protein DEB39_13970 [Planctomycetaceae bacterium]|nr:hypothetical protein [Planctomycetaceae bacterium]
MFVRRMEQSPPPWKKTLRYAALTDVGLRRANNQDSHAVVAAGTDARWNDRGHLFVVADGMGAHAAGEVASKFATETITQSYLRRKNELPHQAIAGAVYDAHRFIREKSAQEEAFRDMGTTVDALLILPQGALIAHVGDSRVYRLRGQVLEQMTFDHSLVWEVCMATNLSFDKAPSYIPKNQITRSLGPTENLKVDLEGLFPVLLGDTFLLCSDGLSGQVSDHEIGQILGVFPPDLAVETLVNLANLRGGPDNITVIVVNAVPTPPGEPEPVDDDTIPLIGWGALGLSFLGLLSFGFSFVSGMLSLWIVSLIATIVFCAIFIGLSAKTLFRSSPYADGIAPFGKGPYTRTRCVPDPEFVEKLTVILHELRQATRNDRWFVESNEADHAEEEGKAAVRRQDTPEAVRQFALAINHLMRELKRVSAHRKK